MVMSIVIQLLYLVPMLLITVGCIIYLLNGNKSAGILMLLGNLMGLAHRFFSIVLQGLMMNDVIGHKTFGRLLTFTTPVYMIMSLLFGIGFIMMALSAKRAEKAV